MTQGKHDRFHLKTQQLKKLHRMALVSMVTVIELLKDSLKNIEESLCSFQKMISHRFIEKKIEKSYLKLFYSIIFVLRSRNLSQMHFIWSTGPQFQMELKAINVINEFATFYSL